MACCDRRFFVQENTEEKIDSLVGNIVLLSVSGDHNRLCYVLQRDV